MSFSFPPATKFAPNSRNDAFSSRRNAASIPGGTGSRDSPGRSRTIYLNFAFIVAFRDYLYHTTLVVVAAAATSPSRGTHLPVSSNSNPARACARALSDASRGTAVKSTTIPEVPIEARAPRTRERSGGRPPTKSRTGARFRARER